MCHLCRAETVETEKNDPNSNTLCHTSMVAGEEETDSVVNYEVSTKTECET